MTAGKAAPAKQGRATRLVRAGLDRSPHGETSEALYLTSGFVYERAASAEARFKGEEAGYVYSRYGNPTVAQFEARMADLEGAEACFATASGMAAVFSALACQLSAGDRLVSSRALFGSCYQVVTQILPRFGIETELVDGSDLEAWRRALAEPPKRPGGAKVAFFETVSNPTLQVLDVPAIVALAREAGAVTVADNVFSTPLLLRPLELGADISVYSGTKHIDGQGRCLGGAILCSRRFYDDRLLPFVRHTGPALSPFNAWLLLKGLETLELRVERQCRTALALAEALEAHPAVARVVYPGLASHPQHELAKRLLEVFGTVLSFEVAGGKEAAFRLLDALELVDISNNLGDAKSLITHPATTTHRSMPEAERRASGIGDGLVRLSAGLEDPADLLADLQQALACATPLAAER